MHEFFERSAVVAAAATLLTMTSAGCGSNMKNLSDPKVLGALAAANQGEVDYSQAGVERTTNDDVEAFARSMITMHTGALATVRQAATDTTLGTEESSTSRGLERKVEREARRIEGDDPGREFDLEFMCAQIRLHSNVLETIDDSLEPSATDQRVRDLVNSTRPVVVQHLQEARTLVQKVYGSSVGADGGATDGTVGDTDGNSDESVGDGGTGGPTTPEDICRSRGGS